MASNGLWWSPLPASSCAWLIVSLSISASSLLGQRWAETEQAICMDQEECHSSNEYKSFYRQITQTFIFSSLRSTRDRSGLQRPYKRITVTSWLSKIHRITSWIHSSHRSQRELEGCPDLHRGQTGFQGRPLVRSGFCPWALSWWRWQSCPPLQTWPCGGMTHLPPHDSPEQYSQRFNDMCHKQTKFHICC